MRRRLTIAWRRWPLALAAFLLAGLPALAHEKWYIDAETASKMRPEVFLGPTVFGVGVFGAAAILFILAWSLDRRLDGSSAMHALDAKISNLKVSPRAVLSAMIGVSLMGAGLAHTLFAPSLLLPDTAWGSTLAVLSIALGTLFLFLEPLLPELSIPLVLLFLAGFTVLPAADLLEELLLVGAAVYFMTSERDRLPWKAWGGGEARRMGYQVFRVLTAVNFLLLASVKWLRPDLAIAIVENYNLNFMSWAGLGADGFVFCAAVVETFVALCLLFRVAFRPAVALAFLFFTLSIYPLGARELLGHLPIKATLFLFFIYGHWHRGEAKA